MRDPYEVLDVPHGASRGEIKSAYRRLARLLHPDAGGDAESFRELVEAFEELRSLPVESLDERRSGWLGGLLGVRVNVRCRTLSGEDF